MVSQDCKCERDCAIPNLGDMKISIKETEFSMETICEKCGGLSDSHVDVDRLINITMEEIRMDNWFFSNHDDQGRPIDLGCNDVRSCKINNYARPKFEHWENRTFRVIGTCVNGCRMEFEWRNWFGKWINDDDNYPIRSIGDTYFQLFLRDLATLDWNSRIM